MLNNSLIVLPFSNGVGGNHSTEEYEGILYLQIKRFFKQISFSDLINEVISLNIGGDTNCEDVLGEHSDEDDHHKHETEDFEDEEFNEIDVILATVLAKMRTLQGEFGNKIVEKEGDPVKLEEDFPSARVKRESEENVSGLLTKALAERSHLTSNAQTVGTMLATIPSILEDHGVSFESISKHLYNLEDSLSKIADKMGDHHEQSHILALENVIESGFTKLAENEAKMTQAVKENGKMLESGLTKVAETNSEVLGGMSDNLHNGLDSIVEKMDYAANLEETLHEGFHSISDKVGDKSKIGDTIHDGLHEISEKVDAINSYGLTGIINSIDDHHKHPYPAVHGGDDHDHHGPCEYESSYLSYIIIGDMCLSVCPHFFGIHLSPCPALPYRTF